MIHPVFRALAFSSIFIFNLALYSQWLQQVSGTTEPLRAVHFINSQTGFLISNSLAFPQFRGGEVFRTTNGGTNWNLVLLDSNLRGKSFYFINVNTGYIAGGSYTTLGYIYKTSNSGINWSIIGDSLSSHIFNLQFVNANTAFAGGTYGVFKTTNNSNSWVKILNLSGGNTYGSRVYFLNQNTGFLAGDTGDVYKTTNSGINWLFNDLGFIQFYDIKFINDNTGYICGDSGTFYRTTNQGSLWTKQNLGITQSLYSMFFPVGNIGYMTGEQTIYKTTDSGNSWFSAFTFTSDTLFSSYFVDQNTGYICGDSGRVYKTTTGGVIGINPVSSEIPKNYSLEQNYPNPFNPTTNIKFSIPEASFVKLAVYDMLGREVESLVSQQLTPGTYVVDWNAAKFSSGIYLYKLTTNAFSLVKKMSLIK